MNTNITNILLNTENANSIITNNISSSSFFSDFDKEFFSVLEEVSRLDRLQSETFRVSNNNNNRRVQENISSIESQTDTEDNSLISQFILSPYENVTSIEMENLYNQLPHLTSNNNSNVFERLSSFDRDTNYDDSLYDTNYDDSLYDTNPIKNVISDKGKTQLVHTKFSPSCKNHTCPITLSDFKEGDCIIQLPCDHCFQEKAIETWVSTEKAECPVCRYKLDSIEKNSE
tara:strand:- start:7554 stop:8243 length:690 start_codon:yes stop_codon:yes gene_type:complete